MNLLASVCRRLLLCDETGELLKLPKWSGIVWHRKYSFCLSELNEICLIRRQDISKKVPMLLYFGYMSIVSYGDYLSHFFTIPQVPNQCNG